MSEQLQKIIAELIDSHQYTYEKLGEFATVGKSTVRKWRYGMIANPSLNKVYKLAKGLNRPLSDFIDADQSNYDYQTGPFSDRLIRAMADRCVDEDVLGKLIKMPERDIQNILASPEPPSDDILRRLSLALFVDVPWLRGDTSVPLYYLDDDEYQVISGYRQASDDTRKAIRAILKAQ